MDGRRAYQHHNVSAPGGFKLVHVVPDEIPLYEPNRKIILIFNSPLPKNVNLNVCFLGLQSRRAFHFVPKLINEYTLEVRGVEHTTPEDAKLSVRTSPDNSVLCTYHRPFVFLSRLNLVEKLIDNESDPIDFLCTAFKLDTKTLPQLDHELTRRFCRNRPVDYHMLRDIDCNGNYGADPDRQQTLVHFAAQWNFVELLRTLLQCPGATRLLKSENHFGSTPAELASQNGHENLAQYLETTDVEGLYQTMSEGNPSLYDVLDKVTNGESHHNGEIRMSKYDSADTDMNGYVKMDHRGVHAESASLQQSNSVDQPLRPERKPRFEPIDDRYSGYDHVPSASTSPKKTVGGVIDDTHAGYDYPPSPNQEGKNKSGTVGGIIDDRYSGYDFPPSPEQKGHTISRADVDQFQRSNTHEYSSQSSREPEDDPLYRSLPNQGQDPSGSRKGSRLERLKEIADKQRPPPLQPRRASSFLESTDTDEGFPTSLSQSQTLSRSSLTVGRDHMAGRVSPGNRHSTGSEMSYQSHDNRNSIISTCSSSSHSSHGSTTEDRQSNIPPPCPAVDYPKKKPSLTRQRASYGAPTPAIRPTSQIPDSEENIYGNTNHRNHPEEVIYGNRESIAHGDGAFYDSIAHAAESEHQYSIVSHGATVGRRRTAPDIHNRPPVQPPPMPRRPMPPPPRRTSAPTGRE